jgi:diacylglycerol O-acyltransferase/trehalose O-mycolyltransferase
LKRTLGHLTSKAIVTGACAASIASPRAALASATVQSSGPVPATFTAPEKPAERSGTLATCPAARDSRYVDLQIDSTSLSLSSSDPVRVRVLLPVGWTASKSWPVLYLLTGHGASYASWSCDTFVETYVGSAPVIVVMPDGTREYATTDSPDTLAAGIPSLYSDWQSASSDGSPEKWETFHTSELPPILASLFGASATRAIGGLSMGGLGVMDYAARHPGMFSAAASYSGFLHTESTLGIATENAAIADAGQSTNAPWGYAPGTLGATLFGTQWPEHDPTALASSLLSLPLFVSAGNGTAGTLPDEDDSSGAETVEAGALSMAQDFVSALTSANGGTVPPKLTEDFYGNGTHSWAYWDAELCRSLPVLMKAMGVAFTPPVSCPAP